MYFIMIYCLCLVHTKTAAASKYVFHHDLLPVSRAYDLCEVNVEGMISQEIKDCKRDVWSLDMKGKAILRLEECG